MLLYKEDFIHILRKCGSRGGDRRSGKSQVICVSIGNKQLDPPWKKLDPPWKMLDPLLNLEK